MSAEFQRKNLDLSRAGCITGIRLRDWSIRAAILAPLICLLQICLLIVLQPSPGSAQTTEVPDQAPINLIDGWTVAKPSTTGFDPAGLAKLSKAITTGEIHNVHAVIIEHAGRLVYEQYGAGPDFAWGEDLGHVDFNHESLHDLRSVTKSVTTALLGIALAGKHRQALDKPVIEYFPELAGKFGPGVQDITLKHVVTMTAGLEWNEMTVPYTDAANDENQMDYAEDPIAMILARPVRDPVGSKWYYNGGLSQVVAEVIQRITGQPIAKYARQSLFAPLGIKKFEWFGSSAWKDGVGPSAASGMRMRARDLAKIGSVYLHQGKWNGRQIIPADWVDLSGQHHVKEIKWGRSTGFYGYGFMWYPGTTRGPERHRLIRAAGNGNQRIFILPNLNLSITVFAGNYNDYSHKSDAKVLDHILAALKR